MSFFVIIFVINVIDCVNFVIISRKSARGSSHSTILQFSLTSFTLGRRDRIVPRQSLSSLSQVCWPIYFTSRWINYSKRGPKYYSVGCFILQLSLKSYAPLGSKWPFGIENHFCEKKKFFRRKSTECRPVEYRYIII